ncbi:fibroin heavy chain isoform X2 [Cynoglossus semilaevis]|uniref:fibroin heavy chain isoform X2 n=1 Tax=Cynoglossus semilaevis TaxID=244447 RepID=UPI0007DCB073|nr:fibroin heavy chain-like isoform X2 [Cynoglossus semilaevis]
MLAPALLQTTLVLWLVQQTLQGGVVKPQSVSWGKVLPARGVNVAMKPGVAGTLGALGNRFGTKAMKTGKLFDSVGRYPGAQLGVGGFRSLGLGSKAGLKQGMLPQGAYGASLGTGMPVGAGLTNGLGLGLGQAGRRVYGAGLGNLPGYGSVAGVGYPGARPGLGLGYPTGQRPEDQVPGVSAADLGGPGLDSLGKTIQDLRRKQLRDFVRLYGHRYKSLGPLLPPGSDAVLGHSASQLQTGGQVRLLDKVFESAGLGQNPGFDELQARGGQGSFGPMIVKRKSITVAAGGVTRQLPLEKYDIGHRDSVLTPRPEDGDPSIQQNQQMLNCGFTGDLSEFLKTEIIQGSVSRPDSGKDGKDVTADAQKENTRPETQQPAVTADKQGDKDLGVGTEDTNKIRIRGTVAVEHRSGGSLSLQGKVGLLVPRAGDGQGVGIGVSEKQEAKGVTAEGQSAEQYAIKEPKVLNIPRQTGRNDQTSRYAGGAGNYLGASLGNGGYGAGLGQGGYLGAAAGKLGAHGQGLYPQGVPGYGDGAYLGAMGNGYGYGNGYSDGYGAGLGYPTELADRGVNKAGKREGFNAGAYGPVQGSYGTLGAGLESAGGKYAGGAGSYGNAPVIPAGLEGDGGYPYAAQPLSLNAEGAKSSSKFDAGVGFGPRQAGYGAHLGATQDALSKESNVANTLV